MMPMNKSLEQYALSMLSMAEQVAKTPGSVCLIGPPGSGKTMIARRVEEAMGLMTDQRQAMASSLIWHAARLPDLILGERPFRAPHHTISEIGMAGKRPDPEVGFPYYGELSLAHGGVLFLDELPEFRKPALDAVVRAAKNGFVEHGVHGGGVVRYPAQFKLVAAMNPCPCGYGSEHPTKKCLCTVERVREYRTRVHDVLALCTVFCMPMLRFEDLAKAQQESPDA